MLQVRLLIQTYKAEDCLEKKLGVGKLFHEINCAVRDT